MRKEGDSCKNKKIVFMGTPEIATYALKALIDKGFEIIAVITQPDKPVGREKQMQFSKIKEFALKNNLILFQPNKLSEIKQELIELKPFAFVTCAFGQFIPESILAIPEFGCINVHASLLPKYRGGAPIHWSIINGDTKTGVCLMKTIKKMDAGDVYCSKEIHIDNNDTTTTLFKKMNDLVYQIVFNELDKVFDLTYKPIAQDESKVTFAYNISKENEKINLNSTAFQIRNLIRGLSEKPGAYCFLDNKKIKFFNAEILSNLSNKQPGTIVNISKNGLEIATNDKDILIKEIQVEGKKRQFVKDIINGKNIFEIGKIFE